MASRSSEFIVLALGHSKNPAGKGKRKYMARGVMVWKQRER